MNAATDKRPSRWLRLAFVVLFSALLLGLAEVGLRLFGPNLETIRHLVDLRVAPYGLKPNTEITFTGLHQPLPRPVTWAINGQGIRADDDIAAQSDKFRIATYGDSEAFGWGVDVADSLQGRMEAIDPSIEAINFGVPGYNATNIADHIERTVSEFNPDLIVYLVHKNDFDDAFRVGDAAVSSSLVRLARFAYYRVFKQPREKELRDSPERIARFRAQIERIEGFCRERGIPLMLAYLKWENRAALPADAATAENFGLPRHLNADAVLDGIPKADSHLTAAAYQKLANYMCEAISGPMPNPEDRRCAPPSWQPREAAAPAPRPAEIPARIDAEIARINSAYVFADMHAHPSRFHRANVESISPEEIEVYRSRHMNLVVANISSDMAYGGNYFKRDGSKVEKGQYKPAPGEPFALTADRLRRLQQTFDRGIAVHADAPGTVEEARRRGAVAVMPALEGADALEGRIENLHELHRMGLRLIQLVHFRANELGHVQTYPYSPGGLTPFGAEVVREANRLGLVIDLAHCNTETIMDVLELSEDPVIFSHGGLKAMLDQDRALTDDEVRAIAGRGGIVGIWPHGKYVPDVSAMVDFLEHAIKVAGIDHVGIASDLRGMSAYAEGFGREAEFRAIAMELLERGHDDDAVGKIMGGNFFRLWQTVAGD